MDDARRLLVQDVTTAIGYIPHLVGTLIILIIGGVLAWLLGRVVTAVLSRVGLDALGHRTGLTDDLARIGVRSRPSRLIGGLVLLIVLIATLVQAIDILGLAPLSDALRNLLNYMPHVVLALALVLLGVIVADTLARGTSGAMSRAGILYHEPAATFLRTIVIVLAMLMALQQLTIESGFLLYVLLVVLAAAALALGIAGGLGARSLAENLVAGRYVEREFAVGDFVRVDGTAGTIERLSATSVIVHTQGDRRVIVPNALLTRVAVESTAAAPPPASQ